MIEQDKAIKTLFYLRCQVREGTEDDMALQMAIAALEKQVPKEPLTHTIKYPYKKDDSVVQCPACRRRLRTRKTTAKGDKHCPDCGQRIDWEGIEI